MDWKDFVGIIIVIALAAIVDFASHFLPFKKENNFPTKAGYFAILIFGIAIYFTINNEINRRTEEIKKEEAMTNEFSTIRNNFDSSLKSFSHLYKDVNSLYQHLNLIRKTTDSNITASENILHEVSGIRRKTINEEYPLLPIVVEFGITLTSDYMLLDKLEPRLKHLSFYEQNIKGKKETTAISGWDFHVFVYKIIINDKDYIELFQDREQEDMRNHTYPLWIKRDSTMLIYNFNYKVRELQIPNNCTSIFDLVNQPIELYLYPPDFSNYPLTLDNLNVNYISFQFGDKTKHTLEVKQFKVDKNNFGGNIHVTFSLSEKQLNDNLRFIYGLDVVY